jgi:excisionase family DNA binding protein
VLEAIDHNQTKKSVGDSMDNIASKPLLLRGTEVAELLGVSRAKAYQLMKQRQIPVVTFGKSVRCPRESLLTLIRDRTELRHEEVGT